jgi:hypothetical protein
MPNLSLKRDRERPELFKKQDHIDMLKENGVKSTIESAD